MPYQPVPSLLIIMGMFNATAGLMWGINRVYYGPKVRRSNRRCCRLSVHQWLARAHRFLFAYRAEESSVISSNITCTTETIKSWRTENRWLTRNSANPTARADLPFDFPASSRMAFFILNRCINQYQALGYKTIAFVQFDGVSRTATLDIP